LSCGTCGPLGSRGVFSHLVPLTSRPLFCSLPSRPSDTLCGALVLGLGVFSAHILVLASAPVLTSTSTASSPTIPLTSIFMPLLRLSEHHVHTTPSRAPLTLFSRLSTTVPTIISDAMFTTPPHTRTLHASITTIFTTVSTPSRTPGSDDSSHAHPSRSSHNFFTTFFTTFPHDSSVILSPQ
jgi:hypothetical protein